MFFPEPNIFVTPNKNRLILFKFYQNLFLKRKLRK